jgi:hypothetical protein
MFKLKTSRIVMAVFLLLAATLSGPPIPVAAQERSGDWSLSSLNGDYAIVGTYGSHLARLMGTFFADGQGNFSGSGRVNLPGPTGQRVLVAISFEGTYTVEADGTGTTVGSVLLPNGARIPSTTDFVVTKSTRLRGVRVATELASAQRELSTVVGGEFVTFVSTLRSE